MPVEARFGRITSFATLDIFFSSELDIPPSVAVKIMNRHNKKKGPNKPVDAKTG